MKRLSFLFVVSAMIFVLCAFLLGQEEKGQRYVVLLGASVGQAWNISALPERIGIQDFVFEYVRGGGFDKTNTLKRLISREEKKPDAIFIKECAAYFPGDIEHYKNLMKKWIELCQKEGIVPIPATVVPVTRLHSFKVILIDIVKGRDPFRYGNPFDNTRNKAILDFNDWIRIYAEENGLAVLDMEAALRYSETNRYLRESFAKLDGLHLNGTGYVYLDRIVIPTLNKVRW